MRSAVEIRDLLVVGANPAIDAYYRLDRLGVGDVNRVASVRRVPGGKANNLGRAYRTLGGNPVTTGIVGGDVGRQILAGLTAEGIAHDYVCTAGESRQTVTLVEREATTVLLEPGPLVSTDVFDALAAKVAAWSAHVPAIAIVGSLPPGAPVSYLARLVEAVRCGSSAFVAVDVAGDALRHAAMAGPHLIKVNIDEFEHAFQTSPGALPDIERLITTLAAGVELLCITGGARGALVLSERDRFVVRTRVEQPVSTAGAGDAFLAGLLRALLRGDGVREAARLASATAAAAVLKVEAGSIDLEEVDAALERTELLDAADFFAEVHS